MTAYADMTPADRAFMARKFPSTFRRLKADHDVIRAEEERRRRKALKRWGPVEKPQIRGFITLKDIKMAYLPFTTVGWDAIVSQRKPKDTARERHAIMWCARMYCGSGLRKKSYPQIGQWLGGRDHSTIMHGVRKVDENFEDYRELIGAIKTNLGVQ